MIFARPVESSSTFAGLRSRCCRLSECMYASPDATCRISVATSGGGGAAAIFSAREPPVRSSVTMTKSKPSSVSCQKAS